MAATEVKEIVVRYRKKIWAAGLLQIVCIALLVGLYDNFESKNHFVVLTLVGLYALLQATAGCLFWVHVVDPPPRRRVYRRLC